MGRIFLWGSGGYLLGSLLVNVERSDIFSVLFVVCALGIAWGVLFTWRSGLLLLIASVFASLGFLVAQTTDIQWSALPGEREGMQEVVIVKRDSPKAFYQPLVVAPVNQDTLTTRILWRAPRTTEVTPGMHINLDCVLKRPENFDPHFDYAHYLATQHIGYICDGEKQMEVLSQKTLWRAVLFRWQSTLQKEITTLLPDPAAGLLTGLFLGGDDSLPQSVSENFRRAGLSHIVAVSGYNMSLVALSVLFISLLSGLWRKTATLCAIIGILIFLLLIDTSAASLRAAFMAWIVFFAFFLGRPANAFNGLFLAGLIMTIINPLLVRYDVGFQLSFMATFMLIAASSWLERLMQKEERGSKLLTLFLSTLVIELGILPILLFHFGTISLLAPIANVFALPLVPLTMMLGFVMLFLQMILPFVGHLFVFPVWGLLMLLIWIAEQFGTFGWSVVEGINFPLSLIIIWYIVLGGALWYSRKSLKRYALRMDH